MLSSSRGPAGNKPVRRRNRYYVRRSGADLPCALQEPRGHELRLSVGDLVEDLLEASDVPSYVVLVSDVAHRGGRDGVVGKGASL